MTNDLIDRFRRWFDYEHDAHAKVLASFDTVPPERRASPEFRKAVSLLAHIVEARRVWLGRMGVIPLSSRTLFPDESDVGHVAAEWRTVHELWSHFLTSAGEKELARVVEYQSFDAGRFRNSVEEILTQLFGHSWYHRGQIAMLVRLAGGQPAATDFVYWCRQPLAATNS
jgi:uncharacterized damage-inducible protein DinB